MRRLEDEIRHVIDNDSEETVALTSKTKARLVRNIMFTIETYYDHLQPVEQDVSDEDIENKSQKVIMNYLTHNNPNGDFKQSTIGADDKRIWWCKGAKAMRDGLIKKGE